MCLSFVYLPQKPIKYKGKIYILRKIHFIYLFVFVILPKLSCSARRQSVFTICDQVLCSVCQNHDLTTVHVGLVVEPVALGQGFLQALRLSPDNIVPPMLRTFLNVPCITLRVGNNSISLRVWNWMIRESQDAQNKLPGMDQAGEMGLSHLPALQHNISSLRLCS